MPDRPSWYAQVPDALDQLRDGEGTTLCRQEVQNLLLVKKRTAQDIITVAGPVQVGNTNVVMRDDLIQYLSRFAPEVTAEEKRRRVRFAANLNKIRQEFIEQPRCLVEVSPEEQKLASKRRLVGLPSGVTLEKGRITVCFESAEDGIRKLMLLAMAIGSDLEEFVERVEVEKRKAAS